MVKFDVRSTGVKEALAKLQAIAPKQIPFTLAVALTETVRDVEVIVKRAIQSDIDRPRPFTINSVYSTRATKTNLEALVTWKDFAGKGNAGRTYLAPLAVGGERNMKRSEVMLKRMGLLPSGFFLTPGQDAPLDQYGNVPSALVVQMLSALRAFSEQGYAANRTRTKETRKLFRDMDKHGDDAAFAKRQASRDKKAPWFVIKPGDKSRMAPGIYKRLSNRRQLIFAIVKTPHYHIQFPFDRITTQAARERFPIQFEKAMLNSLATAK